MAGIAAVRLQLGTVEGRRQVVSFIATGETHWLLFGCRVQSVLGQVLAAGAKDVVEGG